MPKSFPYRRPKKSIDDAFRSFAEDRAAAERLSPEQRRSALARLRARLAKRRPGRDSGS